MPGYEVIDKKELYQCEDILKKSKTFFRMGFEKQRKGIFKVLEFEKKSINSLLVSAGSIELNLILVISQ